jgi:hypothetical protein
MPGSKIKREEEKNNTKNVPMILICGFVSATRAMYATRLLIHSMSSYADAADIPVHVHQKFRWQEQVQAKKMYTWVNLGCSIWAWGN